MAWRPAPARSDRHDGRCDERDSFGFPGRGGGDGFDLPGFARGVWPAWPADDLYTDRGSHYFHTRQAGGKVDRTHLTQVGRALEHLGVEHIAAFSPQARGRSERAYLTLQDRLTKELALAGIATIEAANAFIGQVYIPVHNARFAVEAEQQGSAFMAVAGVDLGEVLCVQEER